MQEGTQIGWDPISINYHLPWGARFFILYLLAVVTISVVKSLGILRTLWLSRRSSLRQSSPEDELVQTLESCSNNVQSIKRWIFITLFWTVLVALMLLRNNFVIVAEQKRIWPGAFYGFTAEMLGIVAFGILVCAVLYTACAFYEGALERRKESRNSISPKE